MEDKKPYENFICQQCYRGIDHEGYYSCELDSNKNLSFNSVACANFDPRYNVKTAYKLYILESRVHELEQKVIKLHPSINIIYDACGTGLNHQPKNLRECTQIYCHDCIYFDMWNSELNKCTSYIKFMKESGANE